MAHGLAAVRACIDHGSKTVGRSLCTQSRSRGEQICDDVRRLRLHELGEIGNVFDGHYERVLRRLRAHVVDDRNVTLPKYRRPGNFTGDNLAENAVRRIHAHLLMKNVHDLLATLPAASETLTVTRIAPSG